MVEGPRHQVCHGAGKTFATSSRRSILPLATLKRVDVRTYRGRRACVLYPSHKAAAEHAIALVKGAPAQRYDRKLAQDPVA